MSITNPLPSITLRFTLPLFFLLCSSIAIAAEYSVVGDHYPPYQYKEDNKIKGFSYDVLIAVLAMNKDLVFRSEIYPWKRALHMLEVNQANILISANFKDSRQRFSLYPAEPMIITPWYLWKRKSDVFTFNSLEDLLGKQVGVVQGYSYTKEFWDFARKNRIYNEIGNYTDGINLTKLNQGKYDVAIAEFGNGMYIKNSLELNEIEPIVSTPLKKDGLYVIFNNVHFSREYVDNFSKNLKKFKI